MAGILTAICCCDQPGCEGQEFCAGLVEVEWAVVIDYIIDGKPAVIDITCTFVDQGGEICSAQTFACEVAEGGPGAIGTFDCNVNLLQTNFCCCDVDAIINPDVPDPPVAQPLVYCRALLQLGTPTFDLVWAKSPAPDCPFEGVYGSFWFGSVSCFGGADCELENVSGTVTMQIL